MSMKRFAAIALMVVGSYTVQLSDIYAQDHLPTDNGLTTYHSGPRYRESESHPLRVLAYVVHPIGWLAREVFFRPLSYFASSTEVTRSVMGYREPFDYRQPECFSGDDSTPDCRTIVPFNYDSFSGSGAAATGTAATTEEGTLVGSERAVYFPDVNFDFDARSLNGLGKSKAAQVGQMLAKDQSVRVVLQGHTDYKGSDQYNMKLGMDRAEAVRHELVALGVSPERLSTVSFGESQPLFAEQEDWARAANRRVEVHPDGGAQVEQPQLKEVE
jgi:outer membrane protein OmpA-like peptidoglycan-associated protein